MCGDQEFDYTLMVKHISIIIDKFHKENLITHLLITLLKLHPTAIVSLRNLFDQQVDMLETFITSTWLYNCHKIPLSIM